MYKNKKIKLSKSLKKIGEKAFFSAPVKTAEFNSKVSIGDYAFSAGKTVIKNNAGIRKTGTVITYATIGEKKTNIKFVKVNGATGYEIKIKAGKKTYKYNTTKNEFNGKVNEKITKHYNEYINSFDGEGMEPVSIIVRPYKVVKGKKVYGKYSVEQLMII